MTEDETVHSKNEVLLEQIFTIIDHMWPSSDISTTSESSGEDLRAKEVEISHLKGELHELKRTLKTASTKSMNQAESATEKTKALETALE